MGCGVVLVCFLFCFVLFCFEIDIDFGFVLILHRKVVITDGLHRVRCVSTLLKAHITALLVCILVSFQYFLSSIVPNPTCAILEKMVRYSWSSGSVYINRSELKQHAPPLRCQLPAKARVTVLSFIHA